jgi:hypothetical protein
MQVQLEIMSLILVPNSWITTFKNSTKTFSMLI